MSAFRRFLLSKMFWVGCVASFLVSFLSILSEYADFIRAVLKPYPSLRFFIASHLHQLILLTVLVLIFSLYVLLRRRFIPVADSIGIGIVAP